MIKKNIKKLINLVIYSLKLQEIKKHKIRHICVFLTPNHNNVGDLAIELAEKKFLKENFPKHKIVTFNSDIVQLANKNLRDSLSNRDILTVHGGGFLGTLWPGQEELFRKLTVTLNDNRLLVFPQTVFYQNSINGEKEIIKSQNIYGDKSIVFFAREKYTYNFLKSNFPKMKCYLMPDMVLYLLDKETTIKKFDLNNKNKVGLCFRNDIEKDTSYKEILMNRLDKYNFEFYSTDTIGKKCIFLTARQQVDRKIKEFKQYDLIITDRLHGMVLSLLSGIPCIVLPSKSPKVYGVYQWIRECDSIKFVKCVEDIDVAILDLNKQEATRFNSKVIKQKFDLMAKVIANAESHK